MIFFVNVSLNAQLQVPEIVFVGQQGHGKSSLIEAFVGFPLFPVGTGIYN